MKIGPIEAKEFDLIDAIKAGFRWIKDKDSQKLFLKLTGVTFAFSIITTFIVIGMLLVGAVGVFSVIGLPESIQSVIKEGIVESFGLELGAISGSITLISGLIIVFLAIVLILAWITLFYLFSFFLCGKIIEKRGINNKYTEINTKNIIDNVIYSIAYSFTVLFNWVSKKMLYIQIFFYIIVAAPIVFLLLEYISGRIIISEIARNTLVIGSFLLIIIGSFPITLGIIYNSYRYYISLPVRIIESAGAREAMKKTWPLTRGYVISLFVLSILIAIVMIAINIPFWIASLIISLIGEISTAIDIWPLSILTSIINLILKSLFSTFVSFIIANIIVDIYFKIKGKRKEKDGGVKEKLVRKIR